MLQIEILQKPRIGTAAKAFPSALNQNHRKGTCPFAVVLIG